MSSQPGSVLRVRPPEPTPEERAAAEAARLRRRVCEEGALLVYLQRGNGRAANALARCAERMMAAEASPACGGGGT